LNRGCISGYVFSAGGEGTDVDDHQGSISAEHGVGFAKNRFLHYSRNEEEIDLMRKIKQVFDPKGIMNPYKVLPPLT
jgi:FAD/FMN-containing dehydrogenase